MRCTRSCCGKTSSRPFLLLRASLLLSVFAVLQEWWLPRVPAVVGSPPHADNLGGPPAQRARLGQGLHWET